MSTNMIGHVRRVRKVDPNGNIYYDRGVSDVIFDPVRGVSVKKDIDDLRAGMLTALQYVAANPKGLDGNSAYEIAVEHGYKELKKSGYGHSKEIQEEMECLLMKLLF